MSLTDGSQKMSKSASSELSRINLLDSAESIAKKVKRAKTDAIEGGVTQGLELSPKGRLTSVAGGVARPEAANLLGLYAMASQQSEEAVLTELSGLGWGAFKPRLADALISELAPVRERHRLLMQDPAHLHQILAQGQARAAAT